MGILYIIVFLLAMLTLGVVFFGAPYVPTRARDLEELFKVAKLTKKDVFIDLGSGDGRLVLAAAQRGIKSIGLELNPLLVLLSLWRIRGVRKLASVHYKNYWRYKLPDDTTTIFVFLAKPFMERLKTYLQAEATRLGRPLTLISYGFELPGYTPVAEHKAIMVYKVEP